jgi:hypothetical protein
MRRKPVVGFNLRDEEDRPLPLLGFRQTQALTLAICRAWAAAALAETRHAEGQGSETLPEEVERVLDEVIVGDPAEIADGLAVLGAAERGPLAVLRDDRPFRAILDRLLDGLILFTFDFATPGTQRIVSFTYDEPLATRYATSEYGDLRHGGARRLSQWERIPRRAALGLSPTLIRFPVPTAALAATYRFEISAPPEVSIIEASLLAGLPNLAFDDDPARDRAAWRRRREMSVSSEARFGPPLRRSPAFDSIKGVYPAVAVQVAEVPVGSLAGAQVRLQASPTGWRAAIVGSTWLATSTLLVGFFANNGRRDVATSVLIAFAAAMVAILARPDPHRMVSRLLSATRGVGAMSAVLTLAGGVALAFANSAVAHWCLGALAGVSALPSGLVTRSLWSSRRERGVRLSPWEQHMPSEGADLTVDPGFGVTLAYALQNADFPYDLAVQQLGFDEPAVTVASAEGEERRFTWNRAFLGEVQERLKSTRSESLEAP